MSWYLLPELGSNLSKNNLLYCLTSSQIWLIPLADDCHSNYLTKLKKHTQKKEKETPDCVSRKLYK
jgi:hypothetical protein